MATFDFARLDPTKYTVDDPLDACSFQNMVRDFMDVVRTNANSLSGHEQHIGRFVNMVKYDKQWALAFAVVPEFRLPQDHRTDEPTLLHHILRNVREKRPRPKAINANKTFEKALIRQRIREAIEYVERIHTEEGTEEPTPEQDQAVDDMTDRMLRHAYLTEPSKNTTREYACRRPLKIEKARFWLRL